MPEYLAPGVFVEEVSYRSKSIEGVSTTTTGFIGPTRSGPLDGPLEVLTSLEDFERVYGDGQQLEWGDHNYMWHGARTFFEQGGRRLYVRRVFGGDADAACANATLGSLTFRARYPGAAGGGTVLLTLNAGPSVLSFDAAHRLVFAGLHVGDVVHTTAVWSDTSPPSPPHGEHAPLSPSVGELFLVSQDDQGWLFTNEAHSAGIRADQLFTVDSPHWDEQLRILTVAVTFTPPGEGALPVVWSGLPLDPSHVMNGRADSVVDLFAAHPATQSPSRIPPLVLEGSPPPTGLAIVEAMEARDPGLIGAALTSRPAAERSVTLALQGGHDGTRPAAGDYEGISADVDNKGGIKAFEDIDDISIVAAPGSTFGYENGYRDDAATIIQLLIGHAERMRYRIAVLDSGDGQAISDVSAMRGTIDTTHAALYYPWVLVLDPITRTEIELPPSGFVSGIYARNDIERAVYKAPANEIVTGAIGFERLLNTAQQEVLNPLGVNCFRFFEGRGYRLWGARTATSDPEWKYVNLRRYFAYLEHSIDRGTQWAVFEPNGEALWANVRRTIADFLFNEFQNGALLGDKPEKAYFVKCDRSTMTQNDLDNGRLVCKIGVAALRPAEFVIFRIGQWTADAQS
jgi:uncharacterized protein